MTPADVSGDDIPMLNNLYREKNKMFAQKYGNKRHKLQIDDLVRIAKPKANFDRGFHPRWTEEKFYIDRIINKSPFPMYILRDYKNTPISGRFYDQQLQKSDNTHHWINQSDLLKQHGIA
uniref:Uncharacterized protein n=1 Tax=Phlebotomus papatasi TaxID=29031 RepID=A0A1B0DLE5_PHLPP